MKRLLILCASLAVIIAGATSCEKKFNSKKRVFPRSIYVETRGVDVSGDTKFIAEMHALVANSVEITNDSFENGDIGFEYCKDSQFSGEVVTVEADSWWVDEEDLQGRKGFSGRAMPLPPSEVFYYRAFLNLEGKKEYGAVYSFRTDDAMVIAVYLDCEQANLTIGETETLQLTATIDPLSAINREVEWSSSNEKVAKVSSTGLVSAVAPGSAKITVTTIEGGKTASCLVSVIGPDPKVVDLGLSVKWADINIGAGSESDPGSYFRWGSPYTPLEYTSTGYIFYYNTGNTVPDSIEGGAYDIARAILGAPWRMPTKDEMNELRTECQLTEETLNGMLGRRFTASNGKSIFLPYGGMIRGTTESEFGETGCYWSATKAGGPNYMESVKSWYLKIAGYTYGMDFEEGHMGLNVRAVQP